MAVIKCKNCGGDMEISADKTFGTCEYCGSTMTLPKVSDEQRAAAFNRGNHFRRMGEFDKALGVYERIVAEDDGDAEAHWCCALCRFGIEYVEDPASYEWLPTCHRASFDSFLEDVDYLAALEHSDGITRRQYQKDAAKIAEVQRGILATSQNAEPYDVFISYKELDANGERTKDSILAQDIYYQLVEQGRRVFFSRITLEDIPGTQYEPYIFAALNSAKVMIVVGTSAENLNAVWVKNEWSRFLAMMRKDKSKLLIPCYRDMDAYDLPEQLAVLMSYDMGRIGFIQDLIRGVSKVLDAEKQKEAPQKKETVVIQQSSGGPNVQALLKRGEMALVDGKWDDAKGYYDRVLDMDAECGEAYLGLFLVENSCRNAEEYAAAQIERLHTCQSEELPACDQQEERIQKTIQDNVVPGYLDEEKLVSLFTFNRTYTSQLHSRQEQLQEKKGFFKENRTLNRAKQYAEPALMEKLQKMEDGVLGFLKDAIAKAQAEDDANIARITAEYAAHLEKAEATANSMGQEARSRREADYEAACQALERTSGVDELEKLSKHFAALNGYKDWSEKIKHCKETAQMLLRKKEKAAQQKTRKIIAITGTVAVLAVALFMLVTKVIIPPIRYNEATKLFTNGDYAGAEIAFEALGDFKDSAEKVSEVKYAAAMEQFTSGDYAGAIIAFEALGSYGDSAEKCMEARYAAAEAKYAAGDYAGAEAAFEALGSFGDSAEKCMEARYAAAEAKYAAEKYPEAAMMFFKAGDYKDSKARYIEASQKAGMHQTLSAGSYHTVGLKSDGTVVAVGENDDGQRNVSGWTDIVAVSAGDWHTVGLKSDGTVVAVGFSDGGRCDVSDWTDIVAVSAGNWHTVGLKADGTVVAVGNNDYGQCDVSGWTDIVAVSAGGCHTVGLKSDGTVVAAGWNRNGQCDVKGWTDIVAVSAGEFYTVGLKSDGTVVAVESNGSGQCDVGGWTDIVAVSAGDDHTVGLKSDGTVVAVGYNWNGQCDVGDWTDIVAVNAGGPHTVGLKADGTVVAVGGNWNGQCNVSDWTDIIVPKV